MSDDRKEYTVTVGGLDHTMLLTSKDAERYGDNAKLGKPSKAVPAPANKAAGAENK